MRVPVLRRAGPLGAVLLLTAGSLAAQAPAASLVQDLRWRNIGPANMAGRVTDIEAVEANPAVVYVASASGGVWKSVNSGTTWTPIFTDQGTGNMGDLAIFQPNPDILWLGTGESCVRNSVGWGDGVYKSTDGGKSWVNVGLRQTHHVSEVLTHPTDPDVVYVAAQGHLWGHTGERGIFKTTDGGRTWRRLGGGLPDDGRTGASDLVMDPTNPQVLYAGFWERLREPHTFTSGGPNGGIFKTTDGGETWTRLSAGLPGGPTGKIGLAVHRRNPRILMAIVEHGYQPEHRVHGRPNPAYDDLTRLGSGIYRSEDGGASWTYVNRYNNRPFYYSHIFLDPNDPDRVYVLAGSASISEDGGRTFARQMEGISGDFHALWIDPADSDRFYVGNDKGSYVTFDGGREYIMFDNMDIGEFYAITVDNRDPYWVYGGLQDNGNWGGPSNSRDYNGILTDHWFKFHAGDGFHTTVDPNDWRTVYTESQGGRIQRFDAVFRQTGTSITPTPATVLNYAQVTGDTSRPAQLPRPRFRFNWSSPLILSPHDSRTVYFGGNHLFRSSDRGDSWTIISPDLSTNDPAVTDPESGGLTRDVTGAETHATLISVAESPLVPGLLWAGTDDGNVQLTRDGGATWTNVRPNLRGVPDRTWVSRVVASRYDAASAYVTFDGHRRDDFRPHVYRTTDFGRTWTSLSANLPADGPVYVLVEDPRNPRLLYVGTEFAVFATVDGGERWLRLMTGLPTVAVHDLVIHPRDGDLVAGTHGRSVWILDDTGPLQQLTPEVLAAPSHLFRSRTATKWRAISRGATRGHKLFMGRNPLTIAQREPQNSPSELQNSATIDFYLRSPGTVTLEISDLRGARSVRTELDGRAGINRHFWDLRFAREAPARAAGGGEEAGGGPPGRAPVAEAGTYVVRLTAGGRTHTGTLTVREDPDAPRQP
jgi:photosystem II stability/assembly factor-like uncharacterized protein